MNNTLKLIISIIIPLAIGALSSYFTIPGVNSWYQTINKPSWNPPNWIFPPVWTLLFVMMGISLFLVWKNNAAVRVKKMAIMIFSIQLLLNILWSYVFFKQHTMGWALAEIIILWIAILLTIFAFGKISSLAAWLLVPYISWVSFAAILNYTFWKIN